ncbi:alaserpin-like [Pectinophora gossypiella]|uniref:alaserpin-like n=1 Tax=Pectinophora gossypiella TaxID=13191 RepID=UPI00214F0C91|nr:alaserpin-like [Pectinophora gossypiella]
MDNDKEMTVVTVEIVATEHHQTKRFTLDVKENLNNRNQLNASIDHIMGMDMLMLYIGMNVVVLPMVVRFGLCKLLTVATGPARDRISQLLDPDTKHVPETLKSCYSRVREALEFLETSDLVLVNKMYLNYSRDIDPSYEANSTTTSGIHVDKVSFNMPASATNYINRWFETATYRRIKNIVLDGEITRKTSIMMLSAAHFKKPFDVRLTKEADFYQMDGKKGKVMMMTTITSALYYADSMFQLGLDMLFNDTASGLDKILRSHKHCKSMYLSRVKQNILFELDEFGVNRNAREAEKNAAFSARDTGYVDADALRQYVHDRQRSRLAGNSRAAFTDFLADRPFLFFIDIALSPFGDHSELLSGAYYGPNKIPETMIKQRMENLTHWW